MHFVAQHVAQRVRIVCMLREAKFAMQQHLSRRLFCCAARIASCGQVVPSDVRGEEETKRGVAARGF